ncbi:MAG: hypothetical protein IKG40_00280 [Bacilli bacterium]|nr:hypothetical protein [Bacilli bacterium]
MEEENKRYDEETDEYQDEYNNELYDEENPNIRRVGTRVERQKIVTTRVERNKTNGNSRRNNNNNKQTKNKKPIIIISIIAAILLIGIVAAFLLNNKEEKPKKDKGIKEKWGEIYYEYLKDLKDEDNAKEAGLPTNMKNAKITFYDITTLDNPVMTISYGINDKNYANIYFIDDKKVNEIIYEEPTEIKLLYNIENKDYNYYTKSSQNSADTYKTIKEVVNAKLKSGNNIKEYTFKESDKDTVKDVNGNEISLTKFEQTFIEVETEESKVSYKTDLTKKALKKVVEKAIKNYETVESILTTNIKKSIETKEEGIIEKKEEMKKASEDVANKEALEKSKKEAEEKAKKEAEEKAKANAGIKVGNYTLKYGTYRGKDATEGDTLVLKQNGQCTYNGSSCTYSVAKHDFAQDESSHSVKDSLVIKTGYTTYLYPSNSSELTDGDISIFTFSN